MSQVLENLYLGSADQGWSPDYLTSRGVTHVLTVDIMPPDPKAEEIVYKFIKAYDHPDSDLLSHLDDCYEFIESALSNGGTVFTHCQFGVSRSATIVVAYLMRRYGLSMDEAISKVAEKRLINPNPGFLHQLLLYQKMGNKVDKRNPEYREYVLKKIAVSPKNVEIPEEILPEDDFEPKAGESADTDRRSLYRCRKCRRNLFTSDCLLKKHEPAQASSTRCSDSLFICPLRWMLQHIRQQEGKILCPNCEAKLGAFRWAGEQCGCGVWVTPSFRVQLCKLDCQTVALKNEFSTTVAQI